MNPWLLTPVSIGVAYALIQVIKITLHQLADYQRACAAEPRKDGVEQSRERGG